MLAFDQWTTCCSRQFNPHLLRLYTSTEQRTQISLAFFHFPNQLIHADIYPDILLQQKFEHFDFRVKLLKKAFFYTELS